MPRTNPAIPIALILTLTPLAAQEPQGEARQEEESPREKRDPTQFTLLRDEGFPLNVDPEVIPAAEAELDDGDLVLGIVHNGVVRAYPVNYMNGPTNEVVNDELGGTAIASTW